MSLRILEAEGMADFCINVFLNLNREDKNLEIE
jgi:hypothetical protein